MQRITIDGQYHHASINLPTGLRKGISQAWTSITPWLIGSAVMLAIGYMVGCSI